MGRRILALIPLVLAACSAPPDPPQIRDGVQVVWLVKTEDCLSCDTPARLLRELKRTHGESVRLTALIVGEEGDSSLVRTFLKRERLDSDYKIIQLTALTAMITSMMDPGTPKIRTVYVVTRSPSGRVVKDFPMSDEEAILEYVASLGIE